MWFSNSLIETISNRKNKNKKRFEKVKWQRSTTLVQQAHNPQIKIAV